MSKPRRSWLTSHVSQVVVDVDFLILGPVQVRIPDRFEAITSRGQRIVLVMLLLDAGRAVSVDRLVDAVYDDEPPSTARNQVQLCVSQLRKRFRKLGVGELIMTDPAGYLVPDPGGSLDLLRFQEHLKAAAAASERSPAEAVTCYRAGLGLWRGDALSDVTSRAIQPAAVGLNESRLAALERCLDLELRLGRHSQVAGELTELVAKYPLRERFRAQLMIALYRSGQQAEALEVFRVGREVKREELGLDPGNELKDLEEAILVGDRTLDLPAESFSRVVAGAPTTVRPRAARTRMAVEGIGSAPVPVPRQLPPAVINFTGRQHLLARICQLLVPPDGADEELVKVVMLSGCGGTGKTVLALHAAHAVRDAFPDGQLYAQFRDEDGSTANPARVLEGLLRTFGIPPSAVPDDLAARAAMYRSWLAGKRALIVADNVADVADAEPLLPGTPGCAVVVTSRNLTIRLPGAHRLEVGPLDEQAGAELLARMIGAERAAAEPEATKGLVALCGGLPLALHIAGSKLAERRHWTVEQMRNRLSDDRRRLDELDLGGGAGVRATLAHSYQNLPKELRLLVTRLSMFGVTDFSAWVAAAALNVDLGDAEDMLAELVSAQLLETRSTPGGSVRYRMKDLVRIYAKEMPPRNESAAERQSVVQHHLACWLALTEKAHGLLMGDGYEILHGNAPRWHFKEKDADTVVADPVSWLTAEQDNLRRTVLLAARAGLSDASWDLALTATLSLIETGRYSDTWREVHKSVMSSMDGAGNRLGAAAMLYALGHVALTRDLEESWEYLHRALLIFGEFRQTHGQGLTLRDLAVADAQAGRHDAAKTGAERALAFLQQAADLPGQASIFITIANIEMDRTNYSVAEDMLSNATMLGHQIGSFRPAMRVQRRVHCGLADLHRRHNEFGRAESLLRSALGSAREAGDLIGQASSLLGLGKTQLDRGELASSLVHLRTAAVCANKARNSALRGEILLTLAGTELALGHDDVAAARAENALDLFRSLASPLWQARCLELSGRLLKRRGQTDEAKQTWREATELAGDADPALVRCLADNLRSPAR